MSGAVKLFIALIIGLIVLLFMMGNIVLLCSDDRFWFCFLLLFAFLAPLLIGLWLLWNGGWDNVRSIAFNDEPKVDRTYVCEGSDCYPVMSKIKAKNGKTTIYHA